MANIKFGLDTRKLESQIKKQQQDAKRMEDRKRREESQRAEEEKRITTAKTIVSNQPIVGGMKMLDKDSEEILKIVLENRIENNEYISNVTYETFPSQYQFALIQIFETLKQYGMIFAFLSFGRGWWRLDLSSQALTYFEDKEKAIEEDKKNRAMQNVNIGNINGSNINFGTISNSTLSASNIINELEKRIEQDGGSDKEELKELLDQVKELTENMKSNCYFPKSKTLMTKVSNHLEKHGWFYGAVVQLIGTAAMQIMMGV